ncbi:MULTISPECIES: TetR family transcriptional regulator [unclassified Amycolatopsis]|uniref:acyl-CoA-like ligand-binding transcription factor n=1 Tax=unclassified Amycolatopsis TaxID=2618356 RepID=UPI0028748B0D|nr:MULTISPECIES: TetR family transcriptional regulator [unclassified Amycolatopsis]MDS0136691.1 TetR family transcriptional regulator [Amycolatopsis sp. 505]MDS0143356.1 TetR family transcriptional regulator [Amycolatopsis sp. CM201R]
MDTDRAGLRERKKRETRIALSWAAIRLTVERGFDNVRIEDIAAEAGVSTRTFSNYFGSKGEAIVARHHDRARAIAAALRARPAGEPIWDALTGAALDGFALGEPVPDGKPADRSWVEGLRLMVAEPALQGEFQKAGAAAEAEFALAVAERTGTDVTRDVYPRLVAGVVGAALNVVTQQWLVADPRPALEDVLRDVFGRLAAGLPEPR